MEQVTQKENAVVEDRIEYIYIEHAIIEQKDSSVCIIRGHDITPIPIASVACLILGPGTSLTHRAVCAIANSGCLIVWSGEDIRTYYASGIQGDRSSKNMLLQARYWADPCLHMRVVRWMYQYRFPSFDARGMGLEQLRGAEGLRMKELYQQYAEMYGIEWNGRAYNSADWEAQDAIQQAVSVGNKFMYDACHAIIASLGFSPALGFIHTGAMRSFVYDIADLYKADYSLPVAFEVTKKKEDFAELRRKLREKMQKNRFIKKVVKDLYEMFELMAEDSASVSKELWDSKSNVEAGVNYSNR